MDFTSAVLHHKAWVNRGIRKPFCDSQAPSFRDPEFADVTHLLALQGCENGIDDFKKNNQSKAERHTLLDQSRNDSNQLANNQSQAL